MSTGSVVFVGIAPHPPIMVPEVGGVMTAQVRGSIDAMRKLTKRIVTCGAETVVIISPHAPLDARSFVAYGDPHVRGDFANFRAPQATVEAALDVELLTTIKEQAALDGYSVTLLNGHAMDHGTTVPLYFLLHNGWEGQVVALGYSFLPDEDHIRFGSCVRRACDVLGKPVAFIASGDLSHRLIPNAPAGYNPDAVLFDKEVVEAIQACVPNNIATIDPFLRQMAGECGYRSMLTALGVSEGAASGCEVLHYEAPFGVGYLVAQILRIGC